MATLLAPIALADLGADLDAALDATGVDGKHEYMSPQLLAAKVIVTTAAIDLRLYCYDEEIGRWFPSETATQTCAVGVRELRFTTAEIKGYYALVKTDGGAGVAQYAFREGRA